MRRLGLVAGVLGAFAGVGVSYIQMQPLLAQRVQYNTFQSLVSSPAVREALDRPNVNPPKAAVRFDEGGNPKNPDIFDQVAAEWVATHREVNRQGIKSIHLSEADNKAKGATPTHKVSSADISDIETSDGQTVSRTEPPAFSSYLLTAAFPALGFFLPWGVIKTLTWIGLGFVHAGDRDASRERGKERQT